MSEYLTPSEKQRRDRKIRNDRVTVARLLGTHTAEEWKALTSEFNFRCVRCGGTYFNVERDHIVPLYQGGSDSITNIQPLCAPCNTGKGPETFNWVKHRRENGF